MANQSEHDWSKYEPSPGKHRGGWLVVRPPAEGGRAVEALVLLDPETPVRVSLVGYGPRGGVHVYESGTVDSLREQIATLMQLKECAQHLEEVRPR